MTKALAKRHADYLYTNVSSYGMTRGEYDQRIADSRGKGDLCWGDDHYAIRPPNVQDFDEYTQEGRKRS